MSKSLDRLEKLASRFEYVLKKMGITSFDDVIRDYFFNSAEGKTLIKNMEKRFVSTTIYAHLYARNSDQITDCTITVTPPLDDGLEKSCAVSLKAKIQAGPDQYKRINKSPTVVEILDWK